MNHAKQEFEPIKDEELKKVVDWLIKEKAGDLIPYVQENRSGVQKIALEIFNKGNGKLSAGDYNTILYYAIDME